MVTTDLGQGHVPLSAFGHGPVTVSALLSPFIKQNTFYCTCALQGNNTTAKCCVSAVIVRLVVKLTLLDKKLKYVWSWENIGDER